MTKTNHGGYSGSCGGGVFAFVSAGINAAKSAYRSLAQRSKVSAGTGECQTPGQCFIAGTLVLTAAGLKPIEEIEVGDEVLAYDEETGEQAYKPVTRLFRNTTEEWYHVKINGEEIVCTGGHPFYVLNAENVESLFFSQNAAFRAAKRYTEIPMSE